MSTRLCLASGQFVINLGAYKSLEGSKGGKTFKGGKSRGGSLILLVIMRVDLNKEDKENIQTNAMAQPCNQSHHTHELQFAMCITKW
jgi:hypothetical protein